MTVSLVGIACEPTCYPASRVGSSASTCVPSEDDCASVTSWPDCTYSSPTLAEDVARTEALHLRLAGSSDALIAENEAMVGAFRVRCAARREIVLPVLQRDQEDTLGLDELR